MDKGTAWVGNVYQKFEAMCLEVEEAMYLDTVKFVENQVQNVGSNMKKFFTDVMQDLDIPSSTDMVKIAVADLPLDPHADTVDGMQKNQKTSIKSTRKCDELLANNLKMIGGVDGEQVSSLDGLRNVNHIEKLYSIHSTKGSKPLKNDDRGKCKNASQNTISKGHEFDNLSRSCSIPETRQDYGTNDKILTSPQASGDNKIVGCDSKVEERETKNHDDISDAELLVDDCCVDDQISGVYLSPKFEGRKGRKPRSLGDGLAAIETCLVIDSYIKGDKMNIQSAGELVFLMDPGRLGNCDAGENKKDDNTELRMEINQDDEMKLEEACVLVDRINLSSVSLEECRQWSYKKKMREVFSLKMKSARRQDYEKLVPKYTDTDTKPRLTNANCLSGELSTGNLKGHDVCESEWELI